MPSNNPRNYIILALIAVIAILALAFFMQPKETPSSKVANIIEDLGNHIKKAGREMDTDRTASEKLGDAIEDAGDSLKEATRD